MTANQGIEAPVTPDRTRSWPTSSLSRRPSSSPGSPGRPGWPARRSGALAGGVTSSWQITAPQPVWLSHGQGSKVYDVDGQAYVDLHGGYGAVAGRARPPGHRRGPCSEQVARGTHFAQPTENAIAVAEELTRRFGLPQWRFGNSGTEATMDAVHLMRSITGRDLIIKVEGGYHGHHDSVQVSVMPEPDEIGTGQRPASARPAAASPTPSSSSRWWPASTIWPEWNGCWTSTRARWPA